MGILERIRELRTQLNDHNRKYYVENAPEISDFEFDLLLRELQELEAAHPEYADPNSPTVRVGSDITSGSAACGTTSRCCRWAIPIRSTSCTEFIERVEKEVGETEFVCELKFDGTAISLTYDHGRLSQAVTRGDGTAGDDVTANVRTIRSVPLVLSGEGYPDLFEIRGEILMPYASFDRLNAEREAAGEPLSPIRATPPQGRSNSCRRPSWPAAAWTARSTSWRATTCPTTRIGKTCKRHANGDSKSRTKCASAGASRRSTNSSPIGTKRAAGSPSPRTA